MREKHRQISFSRWVERLWWTLGGRECVDPAGYENVRAFFRMFEELPPYGGQLDQQLNRVFAQPDPRASERNGVQLMTIHKAKGLEFEVVIVPGLERKTANDSQSLLCWLERTRLQTRLQTRLEDFGPEQSRETEQQELLVAPIGRKGADTDPLYRWIRLQKERREAEEAKRLLYVAATRASRELHLMGTATVKSKPDGTSAIEPGFEQKSALDRMASPGRKFRRRMAEPETRDACPAGSGGFCRSTHRGGLEEDLSAAIAVRLGSRTIYRV